MGDIQLTDKQVPVLERVVRASDQPGYGYAQQNEQEIVELDELEDARLIFGWLQPVQGRKLWIANQSGKVALAKWKRDNNSEGSKT